jgi:2-keto-4-pentenoate hydratase/2-oxohepta-3-ene-1,7-dioic acid hydratase in catechol pathway
VELATFVHPARRVPRLGARLADAGAGEALLDLNRALALQLAERDAGAPEAEADSLLPPDMRAFLARGRVGHHAAEGALAFARSVREANEPARLGDAVVDRGEARLLAPVPRPGKIVAVARNYAAHAAEQGDRTRPSEPVLFLKAPTAVIGPDDAIVLPEASHEVDYEGELAAVIGRTAHGVAAAHALDYVAGYTCANDVSARDFQGVRGQHFLGKSCDTFAPLGPWLVTADEVPDPQRLRLRTRLSGATVQDASTAAMIFPVAELVAFASRLMTLEPGDVVLTGTPAGVGRARRPPRWLAPGDRVEVDIEGVGRLESRVHAAPGRV